MNFALELTGIEKHYGGVKALSGADLRVRPGTVHALLGENGAGKTTLMRIAFGMVRPDAGAVCLRGQQIRLASPLDALARGMGMVHQHFTLVPAMTVAENVALGGSGRYRERDAVRRVDELTARTGLSVPPRARVADLSVGAQQRVEILKALARDVRVLILDEPTAVLAPTESDELLRWIRGFASEDRCVVLITHKLREAMSIADDVSVLRRGRTVLAGQAATADEATLVRAMIGEELVEDVRPPRNDPSSGAVIVHLEHVELAAQPDRVALRDVSLEVRATEILGVVGVEGSGHRELMAILSGRLAPSSGTCQLPDDVAFIPEDRQRDAGILDFTLTENVVLRGLASRRGLMSWRLLAVHAAQVMRRHDVRAEGPHVLLRTLSGGNQQKLIIGREFDPLPAVVIAQNPTRGLDVKATRDVHARLRLAREAGAALVVYSSDVDEVLALADRIAVVHAGRVSEVPPERDRVARAMLGVGA